MGTLNDEQIRAAVKLKFTEAWLGKWLRSESPRRLTASPEDLSL